MLQQQLEKTRAEIKCLSGKVDQVLQYMNHIRHLSVVACRKWSEFKEVSSDASLVAFEINVWNEFSITSVCSGFIFRYSEKLPAYQHGMKIEDSVCHEVLNLDPADLRCWLSDELNVPDHRIVEGGLESFEEQK